MPSGAGNLLADTHATHTPPCLPIHTQHMHTDTQTRTRTHDHLQCSLQLAPCGRAVERGTHVQHMWSWSREHCCELICLSRSRVCCLSFVCIQAAHATHTHTHTHTQTEHTRAHTRSRRPLEFPLFGLRVHEVMSRDEDSVKWRG